MIEPKFPVVEPVVEWHGHLAEVIFLEDVLVPHDQLDDAQTVREREIDGEVKCGVLWCVRGVQSTFRNGCLLPCIEQGDDDEPANED